MPALGAPRAVTSPRQQFGFDIGDDYQLVNYTQLSEYWSRLDRESDRVRVVEMGTTEEGRKMVMAILTSPANHKRLEGLRRTSGRLALGEGLTESDAAALARTGKAVVWIDGGLHASESLGSMQLIETVYRLASGDDAETRRILDQVIVLAVPANPDGIELVANWYMRQTDPRKRTLAGLPRLYQKYIGHDDNRDFYAVTQAETKAMCRVMYREWHPQIVYNHHQTGPPGTVMFAPPFRDPFNYRVDPLVVSGIEVVGAAMLHRFNAEGKPGVTRRSGATYSDWWNGGLRTAAYFHNIIGLLTETIGNPTPTAIPYVPRKLLPSHDLVAPIEPQPWRFRQSVDYSLTANYAVLDYAARHREDLLLNRYRMAARQMALGRGESWTPAPHRAGPADPPTRATGREAFLARERNPEDRNPNGYVLPSDQPDFSTACKLARALWETGVRVDHLAAPTRLGGRTYPANSLVIRCDQAFRPHVLDMFEPQDHPDDIPYPGGPPTPPYDLAGWTLAMQMGVEFHRVFAPIPQELPVLGTRPMAPPASLDARSGVGSLLDCRVNDCFRLANRLLRAGIGVLRTDTAVESGGTVLPAGAFYVPDSAQALEIIAAGARELGIPVRRAATPPMGKAVRRLRIGLWDQYGGSMPSGWIRWVLEQFEFPFEVIYPPAFLQGNLRQRFDVLLLPDGAFRATGRAETAGDAPPQPAPPGEDELPVEYRGRRGRLDAAAVPALREFAAAGGAVIMIGSSTTLARTLGLPVRDHLVDPTTDRPLAREKFYVPGSLLALSVSQDSPLTRGVPPEAIVMFSQDQVFAVTPSDDVKVAAAYPKLPLRSGWAWGQEALSGGAAIIDARFQAGRLVLFGSDPFFRGQSHQAFRFGFNALLGDTNPH